jgi:hypothetical protein
MNKKQQSFSKGAALMVTFCVILIFLFLPLISGHNPMAYMDNLYNSISKGSAYYIPKVRETVQQYQGDTLALTISMNDPQQAERTARLLSGKGIAIQIAEHRLKIDGTLNTVLLNALDDADIMYVNAAERITEKYSYNERLVLFDWWSALKAMQYELNKQKRFDAAKLVTLVQSKAVETSYNYYGITAQNIGDKFGIVLISLAFYVVYTLWYGFGILYLFEGFGMNLGH